VDTGGSYARGGWVDDPVGGYRSDYDILVVVSDERLTNAIDFWSVADDVNGQLERGRPFFIDIVEHGVGLYEAEGFAFASPRKLSPEAENAEAQVTLIAGLLAHRNSSRPRNSLGAKAGKTGPPSSCTRPPSNSITASSYADPLQPKVAQAELPPIAG
jgi:hypothetical protein